MNDRNEPDAGPPEPREIEFDAFLSYSRRDSGQVHQLLTRLKEAGLRIWLDTERLDAGEGWRKGIESAMRRCRDCIVVYGPDGLGPVQTQEESLAQVARNTHQGADPKFLVIPVFLPGAQPEDVSFVQIDTYIQFESEISEPGPFEKLVSALTRVKPRDGSEQLPDEPAPYRGLAPYGTREEESRFFFGRSPQIEQMLERLQLEPFLAVVGASGSGKTSVVQAGLIRELQKGKLKGSERWAHLSFRPGFQPIDALARELAPAGDLSHSEWINTLTAHPGRLPEIVHAWLGDRPRLLLLVDRLEELFLPETDGAQARALARGLVALARHPHQRAWVVCTLRSDFYRELSQHEDLEVLVRGHRLILGPLDDSEIRDVVKKPAEAVGAIFEVGLAEKIIEDAKLHRELDGKFMLPLLQQALQTLWIHRQGRWLTWSRYREVGGVEGALQSHAEAVVANLDRDERSIARRQFNELVRIDERTDNLLGVRADKTRLIDAFPDPTTARRVLRKLTEQRLVVVGGVLEEPAEAAADRDATVELIHDSLASRWETLRGWVRQDREFKLWQQRTERSRQEWERQSRAPGELLEGPRLKEAEAWNEKRGVDLSAKEREYIRLSVLRRERHRRRWIVGLTAALAAMTLLAGYAWLQRQQAVRESRRATAGRLTAEAILYRHSVDRTPLSLLLGVGALELADPGLVLGGPLELVLRKAESLAEPLDTLAFTESTPEEMNPLDLAQPVLAFDPTGRFVAVGRKRVLRIYLNEAERAFQFELPEPMETAAFSPDGRLAVGAGDQVYLWKPRQSSDRPAPILTLSEPVTRVEWTDGGTTLLAGSSAEIQPWPAAHGSILPPEIGYLVGWSVAPDGALIALASEEQLIVRDRATNQIHWSRPRTCHAAIRFSPNGELLACSRDDHVLTLYDSLSGEERGRLGVTSAEKAISKALGVVRSPLGIIQEVRFHPSSERFLALAGSGRIAAIWDLQRQQDGPIVQAEHANLALVRFDADGNRWATADLSARPVQFWDFPDYLPSPYAVTRVRHSPRGERLAFVHTELPVVYLWTWETKRLARLQAATVTPEEDVTESIIEIAFSQDGRYLAGVAEEWEARRYRLLLWDAGSGHPDPVWIAPLPRRYDSLVLSPSGEYAVAGGGKSIRVMKLLADDSSEWVLDREIDGLSFCPGGECVAVATEGGIVLFSFPAGRPMGSMEANRPAAGVHVGPNGERILSWDENGVQLWDRASGRELRRLEMNKVLDAGFHSGGRFLAATDGVRVYVWDGNTGVEVSRMDFDGGVNSLDFKHPAGDRLVVGTTAHGVVPLNWRRQGLKEGACRRLQPFLDVPEQLLPDAFGVEKTTWDKVTEGIDVRRICP